MRRAAASKAALPDERKIDTETIPPEAPTTKATTAEPAPA